MKLGEKRDIVMESEYISIPPKISSDKDLVNLINLLPSSEAEVEQILKQKYFTGYFDRYNLSFSLFDKSCKELLPVKNSLLLDEGFYEERIKNLSDTVNENLFFINRKTTITEYVSKIKVNDYILYALLQPKALAESGSFPDLFLDVSLQKESQIGTLSFAIYESGFLTNRYGEFNYPNRLTDSISLSGINPAFINYFFKNSEDSEIIISSRKNNFIDSFTYNSYVLLFFLFISFIFYFREIFIDLKLVSMFLIASLPASRIFFLI